MQGAMKAKISTKTFLKTTLETILATGLPVFSLPHALCKPKLPVREFRFSVNKRPTVYVCEEYTCKTPLTELDALKAILN